MESKLFDWQSHHAMTSTKVYTSHGSEKHTRSMLKPQLNDVVTYVVPDTLTTCMPYFIVSLHMC